MAKTELTLGQIFENQFDCYTQYTSKGLEELNDEMAMTKERFVRVVSDLLTECEANHANKEKTDCVLPVVSGTLSKDDCMHLIYYGETKDKSIKIDGTKKHLDYIILNMFDWAKTSSRFNADQAQCLLWQRITALANYH